MAHNPVYNAEIKSNGKFARSKRITPKTFLSTYNKIRKKWNTAIS